MGSERTRDRPRVQQRSGGATTCAVTPRHHIHNYGDGKPKHALVDDIPGENGLEAWKGLVKRVGLALAHANLNLSSTRLKPPTGKIEHISRFMWTWGKSCDAKADEHADTHRASPLVPDTPPDMANSGPHGFRASRMLRTWRPSAKPRPASPLALHVRVRAPDPIETSQATHVMRPEPPRLPPQQCRAR